MILELPPNRVRRNYYGGAQLDLFNAMAHRRDGGLSIEEVKNATWLILR